MALLIKSINVSLADTFNTPIGSIDNVKFEIAELKCNHIKLGTLEAFLIDFSNVASIEPLSTQFNYGLNINNNNIFTEIEISY